MGIIRPWKEVRFAMADGLEFDESDILWKGSLQEIETGAVLLVGRLHAEK